MSVISLRRHSVVTLGCVLILAGCSGATTSRGQSHVTAVELLAEVARGGVSCQSRIPAPVPTKHLAEIAVCDPSSQGMMGHVTAMVASSPLAGSQWLSLADRYVQGGGRAAVIAQRAWAIVLPGPNFTESFRGATTERIARATGGTVLRQ